MGKHKCLYGRINSCRTHPKWHVWQGGSAGRWFVTPPYADFNGASAYKLRVIHNTHAEAIKEAMKYA